MKPPGRWRTWRLRRRGCDGTKLRGPLWVVDVWLAVLAPPPHRVQAIAKLHERAATFVHFLQPGIGGVTLTSIRQGRLPTRLARRRPWLLLPAELALLWHAPTHSVRTPQLRTNESREFEPPPVNRLPTSEKPPQLGALGRTAFREHREIFGILPEDRFRHLYLIGLTGAASRRCC